MNHVFEEIFALPMQERAALAMQAAIDKAIEEHSRDGMPMYIWRDGKVVAVPAEELLEKS